MPSDAPVFGLPSCPVPGCYRVRLVKRGPWVPAKIVYLAGLWLVLLAGEPTGEPQRDPWKVRRMGWVAFGKPIDDDAYAQMIAERRDMGRGDLAADPNAPVDWLNGKPVF